MHDIEIEKVCVRIPAARKPELLELAKSWREEGRAKDAGSSSSIPLTGPGGMGWDAKAIASVAKTHFGNYLGMFKKHGWPERGTRMMISAPKHVVATYGSVREFVEQYPIDPIHSQS